MTARIDTLYPGYDVLRKRDTPSWDAVTRRVVDERLAVPREPRFFDPMEWRALQALCDCIVPQRDEERATARATGHPGKDTAHDTEPDAAASGGRHVPLAMMLDTKLHSSTPGDGYRDTRLPPMRDAWRRGLQALDAESRALHELPFASLTAEARNALLHRMQLGDLRDPAWRGMPSALFFAERVLHDLCGLYYAHPQAWSEIGFGGPANPRGYVRLISDRRDPWEPQEAHPGQEDQARKENQGVR